MILNISCIQTYETMGHENVGICDIAGYKKLNQPCFFLLQVNGVNFTNLEHSSAVDVLRKSGQSVDMLIERT